MWLEAHFCPSGNGRRLVFAWVCVLVQGRDVCVGRRGHVIRYADNGLSGSASGRSGMCGSSGLPSQCSHITAPLHASCR